MILCPRDRNELKKHSNSARPVWHCDACSGLFIKDLPIAQLRSTGMKRPREEWDTEINCPEHKEKMEFVTVNGTTIDFCPTCYGMWLDGGEIEGVLGLDVSNVILPQQSSPCDGGSAWSGVDPLSPLIDALVESLFNC